MAESPLGRLDRDRTLDRPGYVGYRLRPYLAGVTLPCHDHDLIVDDHEYPLAGTTTPREQ